MPSCIADEPRDREVGASCRLHNTGSNQSIIQFTAGISPSQVAFSQAGNDLVLTVGTETVTVQNYFASNSSQINAVQFADGTVWDQSFFQNQPPLVVNGSVDLTAAQFNNYSSIQGSGTIFADTAGTYDLSSKSTAAINLSATTNV